MTDQELIQELKDRVAQLENQLTEVQRLAKVNQQIIKDHMDGCDFTSHVDLEKWIFNTFQHEPQDYSGR